MIVGISLMLWAGWHNLRARRIAMQKAQANHAMLTPAQSGQTAGDDGSGMMDPGAKLRGKTAPGFTLKDLDGKKVTVQVGTKSVGWLKDNYPKVERIEVEKNQEMFNLVEIGRADAAVTGKPAAKVFAQAKPALHVLDEQLTTEDYGIAVRKDAPELRAAVNAALKKIKADGTYDKLVQKWFESAPR